MSVNEKMTAIADAIRGYTGKNDKLSLDGMATGVSEVFGVGNSRAEERYEEGKVAEHNEFWNYYQQNGTRTDYTSSFSDAGWTAEIFKPVHNIKPTIATAMFKDSAMEIDLAKHLETLGISLNFSNCTNLANCFKNSKFTKIGTVDASNAIGTNANDIFTGSSNLVTIELLVLSSGSATGGSFGGCTALRNLTIGGTIGWNFSVKECIYLTKDSITSIVEHLLDGATSRTVTFSKTAVNNAFGIDVDDASTYPEGSEYYNLRYSKSKWTFNYA